MSEQEQRRSAGRRLRDSWARPPLVVPGVFNALVARVAERVGFRAVYLSGGALSAASGVPDVGLLTRTEFVEAAATITQATPVPLICDADTGFGEAIHVERTVGLFEAAGAAGIQLEDQRFPKRCGHLSGKELVDVDVMVAKVRAAIAARTDPDFVIIARTDARGVVDFDEAVRRAERYVEAGADVIFPEALQSEREFAEFGRRLSDVRLMANCTEFGKSPNLDANQLGSFGFELILFPLTAFRVAMRAAQEALEGLMVRGHQRDKIPEMMTRAELYELLGYSDYEERDRAYFG